MTQPRGDGGTGSSISTLVYPPLSVNVCLVYRCIYLSPLFTVLQLALYNGRLLVDSLIYHIGLVILSQTRLYSIPV